MRIAIDHSPLVSSHKIAHKIRGTGFYTKNLISALEKYHPEHEYILFTQGEILKDIDIFHFPYFDPFFLTMPFKKMGKTVVTIHDLTPLVFPKLFPVGLKGGIKFKIQSYLAKKADGIITDSEASKLDIEHILKINPDKIFPVLLSAGENFGKKNISDKEKNVLLKKYNVPEKFALYVGDATPNKNLQRLVIASEKANIPLVLVGGALSSEIKNIHPWNKELNFVQEESKKSKNIIILGFVSDEDLVKLYNLCSIFVFPSIYEGFGLPVLEAASCARPVVTSRSGSIPEVIGDSAVFFDPYQINDIVEKMTYVFQNKKIQDEYGKKAHIQSKKFTWKKTADETMQVYKTICKESNF